MSPDGNFVLIRQDLYNPIIYRQIGVVTVVTKRYRTTTGPKICQKSMLLNVRICSFQIKPTLAQPLETYSQASNTGSNCVHRAESKHRLSIQTLLIESVKWTEINKLYNDSCGA